MSKYLINKVETFRIDTETEAKTFIEGLKKQDGEVVKHSIEYKEQKTKGEVLQSWYKVTVKRLYNDEKEPCDAYLEEDTNKITKELQEKNITNYSKFLKLV